MAWLRVDDGFPEHPKLIALGGPADRWTWLEILAYCARRSPRGRVPGGIHDIIRRATPAFLARCESVGLLDRTDDGLFVHDFQDYNGATVDERVAAYLDDHPEASASAVARAIGGRKQLALSAFKRQQRFRESSDAVPAAVPDGNQTVPGGNQTGTDKRFPKRYSARGPHPLKDSLSLGGLNTPPREREVESEDPRRAAWIAYAESRADVQSPTAYARTGYDNGGWPPGHDDTPAPANPVVVATNWIHGHGWDETFDPSMFGDELDRIERATRVAIPDNIRDALRDNWQHERERRYPETTKVDA